MCFVCLFFLLLFHFNFRNLLRWYFRRWICTTALIQVSNHIHVTLLTMCVFYASLFYHRVHHSKHLEQQPLTVMCKVAVVVVVFHVNEKEPNERNAHNYISNAHHQTKWLCQLFKIFDLIRLSHSIDKRIDLIVPFSKWFSYEMVIVSSFRIIIFGFCFALLCLNAGV